MTTLMLPVAGKSSRFPGMRPKWLLTMPCGSLMLERSFSKLALEPFSKIVIICLRDHLEKYCDFDKLKERISKKVDQEVIWVILENPTSSQAETIVKGIEAANANGSFFIKDCDNEFEYRYTGQNEVAVVDLNQVSLIDAKNKSYVQVNELQNITHIVEKNVISNLFCCGGYGFRSSKEFIEAYQEIKSLTTDEIYISHVIAKMLINGRTFTSGMATAYTDWGTCEEYLGFTQKHVTVFCDIDGVLLKNGSWFSQGGWDTDPILENIEALKALQEKGLLYLIITTSRPPSEKENTLSKLQALGLHPDDSIFGLPHNKRVLVNDYSTTNPYPSALAINLERDSTKMKSLFT